MLIDSDTGPVDFQMKPGRTVRIRVLDQKGNPVPKARIFFQNWRGRHAYFAFEQVNQYADQKGIWVWNEAPADAFTADISPPEGMELSEQVLTARGEEYVFRVPEPLVVTGKVVDAVTRKPIKSFRFVPGVRSSATHMNWVDSDAFPAADGNFEYRETHGYFAYLVRVEADGYHAAQSRDIKSTEGKVAIDFELTRGNDILAKVFTPRNVPAEGAKVASGSLGLKSRSAMARSKIVPRLAAAESKPIRQAGFIFRRRPKTSSSLSRTLPDMLISNCRPIGTRRNHSP